MKAKALSSRLRLFKGWGSLWADIKCPVLLVVRHCLFADLKGLGSLKADTEWLGLLPGRN